MKFLPYGTLILLLGLTGCADLWNQNNKEKLPGERIALTQPTLIPKDFSSNTPHLPPAIPNSQWKSLMLGSQVQNPELSQQLSQSLRIKMSAVPSELGFTTSPVVASNMIFTLYPTGEVVAFDWNTGKEKWRNTQLQENDHFSIWSTQYYSGGILYDHDTLYLTNGGSSVMAIDAASGKTKWVYQLRGLSRAVPIIVNNFLVIQTLEGNLYGMHPKDGTIAWLYFGNETEVSTLATTYPVADANVIFVQPAAQTVIAYDSAKNTEIWGQNLIDFSKHDLKDHETSINCTPVHVDGVLYIYNENQLTALNSKTAQILWQTPISIAAPISVSGDTIYTIARAGSANNLVAVDKKNGKAIWVKDLTDYQKGKETVFTAPIIAGSQLGVVNNQGDLRWFNPLTGAFIKTMSIDSGVYTRPIVVNGSLIVTSSNGYITRYQEAKGK